MTKEQGTMAPDDGSLRYALAWTVQWLEALHPAGFPTTLYEAREALRRPEATHELRQTAARVVGKCAHLSHPSLTALHDRVKAALLEWAEVEAQLPKPWFRAQSVASPMVSLLPRSSTAPVRALEPGERLLGHFILPPFQRPPVWTEAQRVRFIESAWGGYPLGHYVLNTFQFGTPRTDMWLLDGQQRIGAVLAYMADEYPVFGRLYSELDDVHHRRWEMGVQFPHLRTELTDPAECLEVYDRLAYGGTPHEPKGT